MLGRDENQIRRSPRLHSEDKIPAGYSGECTPTETYPKEISHSGEQLPTKTYPKEISHSGEQLPTEHPEELLPTKHSGEHTPNETIHSGEHAKVSDFPICPLINQIQLRYKRNSKKNSKK